MMRRITKNINIFKEKMINDDVPSPIHQLLEAIKSVNRMCQGTFSRSEIYIKNICYATKEYLLCFFKVENILNDTSVMLQNNTFYAFSRSEIS